MNIVRENLKDNIGVSDRKHCLLSSLGNKKIQTMPRKECE